MDLEELAMRMAAMEEKAAGQEAAAMQNMFMDKYGAKFSNNGDLGVAILGELNRRGVDVSAADDAVQQILDQLRSEATQLLDQIKADQAAVAQSMDKINQIDEAVQAAAGKAPAAPMPGADPMTGGLPPAPGGAMGGMPPMPPMPPAGGDMGAPPPPDAGAPPAGGDMGAPPPPDMGGLPPLPTGNLGVLSDERMKTLKSRITAARTPKTPPAAPKAPSWKPPKHMLDSVRGGM